jgi:hypothetical protein
MPRRHTLVTPWHAACAEGFGTAAFVLVIFALSVWRNTATPGVNLVPFFTGFTVAALVSLFAPITRADWNLARDLGPRLVAFMLGRGAVAIPRPLRVRPCHRPFDGRTTGRPCPEGAGGRGMHEPTCSREGPTPRSGQSPTSSGRQPPQGGAPVSIQPVGWFSPAQQRVVMALY